MPVTKGHVHVAHMPRRACFNVLPLVLCPVDRVIDLPCIVFLDLNDIAWNLSNCLDVVRASSTLEMQPVHYAALLSELGGTAACSIASFSLYLRLPVLSETLTTNLSSSLSI